MTAKGLLGLTLIAGLCLIAGGCSTGSGIEVAAYGSGLDSDDLGEGYGGGVKLELNPIDVLSIDGRAGYLHFSDTDIDMFPLEVAGLWNFPILFERVVPYAGVGAGYYLFEGDGADIDAEIGYFPVAGLEIGFHKFSLMGEARYLFLNPEADDGNGPLETVTDPDVDGLGVNLGLLWRF